MMFFAYIEMDSEHLYIANSSTSKVLNAEKVILKMNFEKKNSLNNVIQVVEIKLNVWIMVEQK